MRPSPYFLSSHQYSVTWEISLNYKERPYSFLPQHNCQFHRRIDYLQLSPAIQKFSFFLNDICYNKSFQIGLLARWTCLILFLAEVSLETLLLVFPAFSYSAPPVNKCSGFFPTRASIMRATRHYFLTAKLISTIEFSVAAPSSGFFHFCGLVTYHRKAYT